MERDTERSFLQGLGERAERVIRDLGERVQGRLEAFGSVGDMPVTEHVAAVTGATSSARSREEIREPKEVLGASSREEVGSNLSETVDRYPFLALFVSASLCFFIGRLLVYRR
jgi:hypothetical protein